MTYSNNQIYRLSCSLSIVGSLLVMLTCYNPKYSRMKRGRQLIFWLSLCDFLTSTIYFLNSFTTGDTSCTIYALLTIFFPVASFVWTDLIAYYLCTTIVYRQMYKSEADWRISVAIFHILSWGTGMVCILIVGLKNHAGNSDDDVSTNTGGWCWVTGTTTMSLFIYELIGGKFVEWMSCFIILPVLYAISGYHLVVLNSSNLLNDTDTPEKTQTAIYTPMDPSTHESFLSYISVEVDDSSESVDLSSSLNPSNMPYMKYQQYPRGRSDDSLALDNANRAARSRNGSDTSDLLLYDSASNSVSRVIPSWTQSAPPPHSYDPPSTATAIAATTNSNNNNFVVNQIHDIGSNSNISYRGSSIEGEDVRVTVTVHPSSSLDLHPARTSSNVSNMSNVSSMARETLPDDCRSSSMTDNLTYRDYLSRSSLTGQARQAFRSTPDGMLNLHLDEISISTPVKYLHGDVRGTGEEGAERGTEDGMPFRASELSELDLEGGGDNAQSTVSGTERGGRKKAKPTPQSKFRQYYTKMALVPMLFFFIRIWGTLNVILHLVYPSSQFLWLSMCQAIFDPSQGFVNFVLFVLTSNDEMELLKTKLYSVVHKFSLSFSDASSHSHLSGPDSAVHSHNNNNYLLLTHGHDNDDSNMNNHGNNDS